MVNVSIYSALEAQLHTVNNTTVYLLFPITKTMKIALQLESCQ